MSIIIIFNHTTSDTIHLTYVYLTNLHLEAFSLSSFQFCALKHNNQYILAPISSTDISCLVNNVVTKSKEFSHV